MRSTFVACLVRPLRAGFLWIVEKLWTIFSFLLIALAVSLDMNDLGIDVRMQIFDRRGHSAPEEIPLFVGYNPVFVSPECGTYCVTTCQICDSASCLPLYECAHTPFGMENTGTLRAELPALACATYVGAGCISVHERVHRWFSLERKPELLTVGCTMCGDTGRVICNTCLRCNQCGATTYTSLPCSTCTVCPIKINELGLRYEKVGFLKKWLHFLFIQQLCQVCGVQASPGGPLCYACTRCDSRDLALRGRGAFERWAKGPWNDFIAYCHFGRLIAPNVAQVHADPLFPLSANRAALSMCSRCGDTPVSRTPPHVPDKICLAALGPHCAKCWRGICLSCGRRLSSAFGLASSVALPAAVVLLQRCHLCEREQRQILLGYSKWNLPPVREPAGPVADIFEWE